MARLPPFGWRLLGTGILGSRGFRYVISGRDVSKNIMETLKL